MRANLFAVIGLVGMTMAGCATTQHIQPRTALDTDNGSVTVLSAYLRGEDPAVVRGMVRRATSAAGPVRGHLHVTAFARDGSVLARRVARWEGSLAARFPAARFYHAKLGVSREQVASLEVTYARDDHEPGDDFK